MNTSGRKKVAVSTKVGTDAKKKPSLSTSARSGTPIKKPLVASKGKSGVVQLCILFAKHSVFYFIFFVFCFFFRSQFTQV